MEENKVNTPWGWESFCEESTAGDDDDDTLSLCHFSLLDNSDDTLVAGGGGGAIVVIQSPRCSFEFEFISPQTEVVFTDPDFLFCRPDPVCPDTVQSVSNGIHSLLSIDRSDSFGSFRSLKDYSVVHSQVQKVNITSLKTMSPKSRRRMFMFGPVKFKPEMELSAIKERQSRRRVPNEKMFSAAAVGVAEAGETVAIGGGGSSRRKRKQWKLIKALKSRVHFADVFAKSFGCFPLSATGVRKLIAVAD